jgi:hypothetical protein
MSGDHSIKGFAECLEIVLKIRLDQLLQFRMEVPEMQIVDKVL